jgi:hypothetical protein
MAKSAAVPKPAPVSDPTDSAPSPEQNGNRPVHTIRYRGCEAAIWRNVGTNGTPYHCVTVRKSYKDDADQWHDVQSFLFSDLPNLAKAISDAHSWIAWSERQEAGQKGGKR